MASPSRPPEPSAAERTARSIRIGERSAHLIALSDAALAQLPTLAVPEISKEEAASGSTTARDTALSRQMARGHVVVVNSDPNFLDAVRVMLQSNRYNVTSTNLVPQTFSMVQAAGADALVIDLATGEAALWALVKELMADSQTRLLPVVLTATDETMLEAAETHRWPSTGRFHLLKPFDPVLLGDVIYALIGPA